MGHTVFIEDMKFCIKPLRSRLEAIQKLNLLQQLKDVDVLQEW